jgi:hypothetical protein
VDASYLNLTPGTRTGVVQDEALERLAKELAETEAKLLAIIEEQQRAEDEQASRDVLRSVQKALKEALLALPAEEYDWFNVRKKEEERLRPSPTGTRDNETETPETAESFVLRDAAFSDGDEADSNGGVQKEFFECAGPLYSVKISPASSVLSVGASRSFRAVSRDKSRRTVEENLKYNWTIADGHGLLENESGEIVTFHASAEPG